jgi:ABC-2 type transport system ATP-binding protein
VARSRTAGAVGDALAELGLESLATRRARALSLGNRQRLGLAAVLLHGPRLIVLDEPTNALDPRGVILLRESLLRRAAEGSGVLVSSHHLDEVARIADRISVLNAGRLIGTLAPGRADLERAFFDAVYADDEKRREAGDIES